MTENRNEIVSPCISECKLDEQAVCMGCYRSIDDIVAWRTMDDEARLEAIEAAKQRRLTLQSQ